MLKNHDSERQACNRFSPKLVQHTWQVCTYVTAGMAISYSKHHKTVKYNTMHPLVVFVGCIP